MLPRRDLLEGARDPKALEALIQQAEVVLRTYQPSWSAFLTGPQREEAEERFSPLGELHLRSAGGFPQAERRLLQISRSDQAADAGEPAPLALVEVSGNFLFDPAEPTAIRAALIDQHSIDPPNLGDVLVRGDRGALVIVTSAMAERLQEQSLQVRSVDCQLQAGDWSRLPSQASSSKSLTSVEASLRLDAIASAGFGVSRSKMATWIRQGRIRVDWAVVTTPSRELQSGERVQLEGRGELVLDRVDRTKRDRWRLQMTRRR